MIARAAGLDNALRHKYIWNKLNSSSSWTIDLRYCVCDCLKNSNSAPPRGVGMVGDDKEGEGLEHATKKVW